MTDRPVAMERNEIAALIPHQGAMCLLERVIEWDEHHAVLSTATHRSLENPLRLEGRLRSIHLCEYGAQAIAVHGGLCARAAGTQAQPGFLVSLRDVTLNIDFIEALPGELRIRTQRLLVGGGNWQYAFEIRHDETILTLGRAAIMASRGPVA
jgi:predicted hotdog family 3-hydroxylacyl-ACP dehydratase